jgi:hypothetical protein
VGEKLLSVRREVAQAIELDEAYVTLENRAQDRSNRAAVLGVWVHDDHAFKP